MDMLTDQALLARIEEFLAAHDMAPSRFGREAMGDGALVQHIKDGRSLSLRNANKVLAYINGYQPARPASQVAA